MAAGSHEMRENFSLSLEKALLWLFAKMFSFVRKGAATDSRLHMKGAALCVNLEAVILSQNHSYYSMPIRTRGGLFRNDDWRSARVFTTALGVKIRRINGRYQYNPPSLKFSCVRVLDHHFPDQANPKLYPTVQK